MAEEKIFTIPLKDVFDRSRKKRAERAIRLVRSFLKKHTKTDNIFIGKSINEYIWQHSMQLPPRSIHVHMLKKKDAVYSETVGTEIKVLEKETKEQKEKAKKEKIKKRREESKKKPEEKAQQEKTAETHKPEESKGSIELDVNKTVSDK